MLETILGIFVLIITGCGVVIGAIQLLHKTYDERFDKRTAHANWLESDKIEEIYLTSLSFCLEKVESYFTKSWSRVALNKCVAIGGVYGFFFFLIAWLSGYHGHIFNVSVYSVQQPFELRILAFSIIFIASLISAYFWRLSKFNGSINWIYVVIGGCILSGIGVPLNLWIAQADGISGVILGLSVGPAVLLLGAAISGVLPISGSILVLLGIISFLLAIIFDHSGANSKIVASFLGLFGFCALLPLLNGFFDWISWAISRIFAENIKNRQTRWVFIRDILIYDVLLAIILVMFVPILLVFGFSLANILIFYCGISLNFNYIPILSAAAADPFGSDGIWFTLMFLTNLIPTFFHLVLSVSGLPLIIIPIKTRKFAANNMKNKDYALALIISLFSIIIGITIISSICVGIYIFIGIFGLDLLNLVYGTACELSSLLSSPCSS